MESLGKSLNIVNSNTGNDGIAYLDMSNVPEFTTIERIAYVHDVKIGTTKYETGFVTFLLKDCNANLVAARLFNVENFMMSGVNAATLKHKPVHFKCVVQEYHGSLSIVLDGDFGIQIYNGEFDYSKFIGAVDYNLDELIKYSSRFNLTDLPFDGVISIPTEWCTVPLDSVCDGRLAGYAKLVEVAFNTISPFITDENGDELLSIFWITMIQYFRFLKAKQNTEVISNLNSYSMLCDMNAQYAKSDNRLVYLDALRAVLGVEKPLHLYAHYLKNAVQCAKQMTSLTLKFKAMPLGTKINVGGVDLSKY